MVRTRMAGLLAATRWRDAGGLIFLGLCAGLPVYALGESMGGGVVLTALASAHPPRVSGVILVAPAVWSREDMPLPYRVVLWIGAHVIPGLHVSGEGLHIWASDNLDVLRRL